MSDILDLDSLEPRELVIKIGGTDVTVKPPTTIDLLRVGGISGQISIQLLDNDPKNDPELQKLIDLLKARLVKIIPELKDREINIMQMQNLVNALDEASIPEDTVKLKDEGVTVGDPKAPSA